MLRKRDTDAAPPAPKHIEIWGQLEAANRFFRRIAAGSVLVAALAMGIAAYGLVVAVHRPLVFAVDSDGQASSRGRRANHFAPINAEIRYVAKRFLSATLAFHSETIESDLAEGWNLMTPELQKEMAQQFAEYEEKRGTPFVQYVKEQQIRTTLDFHSIDLKNHNDKVWAARVRGTARTWPLNRVGADAGVQVRDFEAQITLVRAPRTELTPNGVLVSKQATRFFEPQDPAADAEAQVTPDGKR